MRRNRARAEAEAAADREAPVDDDVPELTEASSDAVCRARAGGDRGAGLVRPRGRQPRPRARADRRRRGNRGASIARVRPRTTNCRVGSRSTAARRASPARAGLGHRRAHDAARLGCAHRRGRGAVPPIRCMGRAAARRSPRWRRRVDRRWPRSRAARTEARARRGGRGPARGGGRNRRSEEARTTAILGPSPPMRSWDARRMRWSRSTAPCLGRGVRCCLPRRVPDEPLPSRRLGPAPAPLARRPTTARWQALAEEIRMQVLQRIDIFTDTGLREQLARSCSRSSTAPAPRWSRRSTSTSAAPARVHRRGDRARDPEVAREGG